MKRRKGIWVGVALLMAGAGAVAQQPAAVPQPDQARITYLLGPDDTVTIHAQNAPDLSEKPFRVDAAGEIKLPMIGRVHAGGLTTEQLEAEIATRLKVYLVEPEVTVGITEFRSQPVSIVGAVAAPGVHQLEEMCIRDRASDVRARLREPD